jgi:hypothetical protein
MAHSNNPVFSQMPVSFRKTLTAQKATLSGVTDATLLIAAPATEGILVSRLWIAPLANLSTANRVDLYISPDGTAATWVDSVLCPVTTLAATTRLTPTPFADWDEENPLFIPAGERLYAGLATAFASGIVVAGQGETFTAAATV